MGTGDAECFIAVSRRMLGMNDGTSYGKALTSELMPRTAESEEIDEGQLAEAVVEVGELTSCSERLLVPLNLLSGSITPPGNLGRTHDGHEAPREGEDGRALGAANDARERSGGGLANLDLIEETSASSSVAEKGGKARPWDHEEGRRAARGAPARSRRREGRGCGNRTLQRERAQQKESSSNSNRNSLCSGRSTSSRVRQLGESRRRSMNWRMRGRAMSTGN